MVAHQQTKLNMSKTLKAYTHTPWFLHYVCSVEPPPAAFSPAFTAPHRQRGSGVALILTACKLRHQTELKQQLHCRLCRYVWSSSGKMLMMCGCGSPPFDAVYNFDTHFCYGSLCFCNTQSLTLWGTEKDVEASCFSSTFLVTNINGMELHNAVFLSQPNGCDPNFRTPMILLHDEDIASVTTRCLHLPRPMQHLKQTS